MASIRSIVANLKGALAVGGIEAMAETHSAAVRSCLSYRLFCGLLNLAYPATPLLELLKNLDRRIGELGVTGASKALLGTLPTSWSAEFPAEEEARIRGRPVVVFGKHGSILTPFLVAASLDRPDLKMLGASYVTKLGPNVAALTYPVHLPIPTLRRAARKGVLLRLGAWLTAKLDCSIDKNVARERNHASIAGAAEHVRRGGALLIAPDARNPKAKWRSGIGLLIAHLVRDGDAGRGACLVPYRIWASITGIFHLLSCNPALRALGRWEYRRPIRVVFGRPIPVIAVIEEAGLDPEAITGYLEAHYRGLGF